MKRFAFRPLILALALLFGGGTAALACSCMAPPAPDQSRDMARATLRNAVAIVEVEVLTAFRARPQRGEQVRLRRALWGRAPARFTLERGPFPSSASCDLLFRAGERRVMILYPAQRTPRAGVPSFRPHSLCADYLVSSPRHLAVLLEEARRRPRA